MSQERGGWDVSVLVPVVERHDDLGPLLREAALALEKRGLRSEFIVLVSGEFGDALEQALGLREADPGRLRVIRFARPVNEAVALAVGFGRARGRVVMTLPSYFDADPACLETLHAAVCEGADLVYGARGGPPQGALKRLQSAVFNRLASWSTGTPFRDMASGTRAIRREVLDEVHLYGDYHRFLPVLADRMGFSVREVAVPRDPRARPPAVYPLRTYLWRSIDLLSVFFLSRFTRRPLRLFGGIGSLFGLAGAGILAVVGVQRILGEPLADRPILVLGTLLLGLGVQIFTIGLLGELLLFFHARDVRDYRVADVSASEDPPLPRPGVAEAEAPPSAAPAGEDTAQGPGTR